MNTCKKIAKDMRGTSMVGDPDREVCAGRQSYRRIDAYRRINKRKFRRVPLKERRRDEEVRYGKSQLLPRLINLKKAFKKKYRRLFFSLLTFKHF